LFGHCNEGEATNTSVTHGISKIFARLGIMFQNLKSQISQANALIIGPQ